MRGEGRYTDDVSRPGQAYAVMVRSSVAHGVIRGIDTAAAKAMPGVLAVFTAADLTAYGPLKSTMPLKNRDGSPIRYTPRPALSGDKVRFVGDPVACVIAQTVAQAKDAAEAVALDIEPLPVVLDPAEAVKPGAPLVYDAVPNNRRARLPIRRPRQGRGGLRESRPCHAAADLQSAHGRRRHGAARGDRRVRRGKRKMDAAFDAARACSA